MTSRHRSPLANKKIAKQARFQMRQQLSDSKDLRTPHDNVNGRIQKISADRVTARAVTLLEWQIEIRL